jgi:MutS domain V
MKAFLMYRDQDFRLHTGIPPNATDLTKDLGLDTLFDAMAGGDQFLLEVVKTAVLASVPEPHAISYRQEVLRDCIEHPDLVRQIYGIAEEAIERERRVWGWTSELPSSALHRATDVLEIFSGLLKQLRRIADERGSEFGSEGFRRFFGMLIRELDDGYLRTIEEHLRRLEFPNGVLMSAELSKDLKGASYILRKLLDRKLSWKERVQSWLGWGSESFVYEVADRDEGGFRALSELQSRGIAHVAAALGQSTDHILSFFQMLRLEMGFYIACLNLCERLSGKGEPFCFPEPLPASAQMLSTRGIYDVCLSLSMDGRAVGNEIAAENKALIVITGANRGGKSTLLRSVGQALLMMQCGMFVPADSFRANVCFGLFTHFKREEDVDMKSGKLDEELRRMSSIVEKLTPNTIILLNESFASTNEREGSEIAQQIVHALLESGMKVLYVTHLFALAHGFYAERGDDTLFLRAERLGDGRRTFRLTEGEPLPTSHGEDLYRRVFKESSAPAAFDAKFADEAFAYGACQCRPTSSGFSQP